jgi:hypothetical protein
LTKRYQRGNHNPYIRQQNDQKIPEGVLSDIRILNTPLVSFGHCVVWYTDSDCSFGIFWSLCCLIYRWICISDNTMTKRYQRGNQNLYIRQHNGQKIPKGKSESGHCVFWYTDSDFPFGIFWSLCCLLYRLWFPLWYLLVIVFWPKDTKGEIRICISDNTMTKRYQRDNQNLYIVLSDIQILIVPLVSFGHCVVWYTDSDCPFGFFWGTIRICISDNTMTKRYQRDNQNLYIRQHNDQKIPKALVSFGHCVVWYTDSDFPFAIF